MLGAISVLSLSGRLKPGPYLAAATAVVAVQHGLVAVILWRFAPRAALAGQLSPFPFLLTSPAGLSAPVSDTLTFACVLLAIAAAWALWSLGLARAADRGGGRELAALSMAPLVQLAAIPALAIGKTGAAPSDDETVAAWADSTWAVTAGASVALGSVAMGTLLFGVYGWTLFLLSPFFIGWATGYVANHRTDLGGWRTFSLVVVAGLIGAIALLSFALEGMVCLVMASPFALGIGGIGGLFGRSIAAARHPPIADTFSALIALPLAFAIERGLPETTRFVSVESIDVRVPPSAVWTAVTHMGRIDARPGLPFQLGLSYPTAGVIHGQGVCAIREGHFSTGVAYERVTEWTPGRRLTFDVLSDAPSMRELSPYRTVHAPHVEGYFRTRTAQFDITPIAVGARLTLTTTHELDLNPSFYWTPIAEWVTAQNKARVLAHFKRLAERAPAAA